MFAVNETYVISHTGRDIVDLCGPSIISGSNPYCWTNLKRLLFFNINWILQVSFLFFKIQNVSVDPKLFYFQITSHRWCVLSPKCIWQWRQNCWVSAWFRCIWFYHINTSINLFTKVKHFVFQKYYPINWFRCVTKVSAHYWYFVLFIYGYLWIHMNPDKPIHFYEVFHPNYAYHIFSSFWVYFVH